MSQLAQDLYSRLESEVEKILSQEGLELWFLEFILESGRNMLRIYIDKPGGVTIDDCERMSRQINSMLDAGDLISKKHTLEVSSPGINRYLVKVEHFERYNGSMVRIKLKPVVTGRKKFSGRIDAVQGGMVTLVDDNESARYNLNISDIQNARLIVKL